MGNKKVIISLQGRSCTGKSAVGDIVKEKYLGIYTVDFDKVKRQLSGYDRNNDAEDMRKMSFGLFELVCKTGKPILLIVTPYHDEEQYLEYKKVADIYNYSFYNFDFIASKEVLIQRYRERLDYVNKNGNKIKIRTEEEYLKILETKFFIPENSVKFDTTNTQPEEIAEKIINLIK